MSNTEKRDRIVIGLVGQKGVGKSAVADMLVDEGFRTTAFAEMLKEVALWISPRVGGEPWPIGQLALDEKKRTNPEVRRFLQDLGSLIRRYDSDYWIREVIDTLDVFAREAERGGNVYDYVVSDVRYLNEAEALREEGAVLIRIEAPKPEAGVGYDPHASETEQARIDVDYTIHNKMLGLDRLRADVLEVLCEIKVKAGAA